MDPTAGVSPGRASLGCLNAVPPSPILSSGLGTLGSLGGRAKTGASRSGVVKKEPAPEEEGKRMEWRCLIWASEEVWLLEERPKVGVVGEEVLELEWTPLVVELAAESRRPAELGLMDIRRGGVPAPEGLGEGATTVAPKGIPALESR